MNKLFLHIAVRELKQDCKKSIQCPRSKTETNGLALSFKNRDELSWDGSITRDRYPVKRFDQTFCNAISKRISI
jgi:hypothetical protein